MQAQQTELNQLIESHRRRLYGFFRGRVRDDAAARDLVQDTWVEVLDHGHTFDPSIGSFWAFTLIWGKIVLARYREKAQRDPVMEMASNDEGGEDPVGDRTPDGGMPSEDRLGRGEAFLELLRRVAACSRPPHEVLTLGFTRLEWRPQEIVAELASQSLAELHAKLERDYAQLVPMPALYAAFLPLRMKLPLAVREVMPDRRTREIYAGILERVAGETKLTDYFRSDHSSEALLARWSDSVKRSVLAEIRKTGRGMLFERLRGRGSR